MNLGITSATQRALQRFPCMLCGSISVVLVQGLRKERPASPAAAPQPRRKPAGPRTVAAAPHAPREALHSHNPMGACHHCLTKGRTYVLVQSTWLAVLSQVHQTHTRPDPLLPTVMQHALASLRQRETWTRGRRATHGHACPAARLIGPTEA